MILILDNRDSFVFNLDQALRAAGAETEVVRGDRSTAAEILRRPADALVLSPGPGRPEDAGCLVDVVRHAPPDLPILGVCLGCQALAAAAGGRISRAPEVVHGRCSPIRHDGSRLFAGIESPFLACRYHSLAIAPDDLPDAYRAVAWTEDGAVLMGIRHRTAPRFGVQFHPESFQTPSGPRLLRNFSALARARLAS